MLSLNRVCILCRFFFNGKYFEDSYKVIRKFGFILDILVFISMFTGLNPTNIGIPIIIFLNCITPVISIILTEIIDFTLEWATSEQELNSNNICNKFK